MKKIKEMLRRIGTAGLAAIMLTALVKKTDFHEDVPTRCDCRIVREVEA